MALHCKDLVTVSPKELSFFLGHPHSYDQRLAIRNRCDFPIRYKVRVSRASIYKVKKQFGSIIRSRDEVFINCRCIDPRRTQLDLNSLITVTFYDNYTSKIIGKEHIILRLSPGYTGRQSFFLDWYDWIKETDDSEDTIQTPRSKNNRNVIVYSNKSSLELEDKARGTIREIRVYSNKIKKSGKKSSNEPNKHSCLDDDWVIINTKCLQKPNSERQGVKQETMLSPPYFDSDDEDTGARTVVDTQTESEDGEEVVSSYSIQSNETFRFFATTVRMCLGLIVAYVCFYILTTK